MVPYCFLTGGGLADESNFVEVNENRFRRFLRPFLLDVEVDEQWYLTVNHDVREAVQTGLLNSAKEHYANAGYFEDRWPRAIDVDEAWYLKAYPDVADAIRAGKFRTAQQHFQLDGFREGRLPSADWTLRDDGPSRKALLRAV